MTQADQGYLMCVFSLARRHPLSCHLAGNVDKSIYFRMDNFHRPKLIFITNFVMQSCLFFTLLKYLQSFSLNAFLYFEINFSFSSELSTQKELGHTKSLQTRHSGHARMILLSNCFACRHVRIHSKQKQ